MNKFINQFKNFRFKGTVIMFLIFVVLLGFVLLFEKKRPTKTEEELTGEKKETFTVWDINKDEVQKLEISYKNQNFKIVKEEDKWQALKSRGFEAKKEKVDEILEDLVKLEGEKKITEANLADFGLDKPELKAKITLKNRKQFELLIGNENPEKTKNYAKRSDENYVFLVDQSLKESLEIKEGELKK
ncbi:MAG: DUF4340 domain-containing protein [Patescibacteria group bacterium]